MLHTVGRYVGATRLKYYCTVWGKSWGEACEWGCIILIHIPSAADNIGWILINSEGSEESKENAREGGSTIRLVHLQLFQLLYCVYLWDALHCKETRSILPHASSDRPVNVTTVWWMLGTLYGLPILTIILAIIDVPSLFLWVGVSSQCLSKLVQLVGLSTVWGVSVMGDRRYSALMIVQADLHNPQLACVDLLGILQFTNEFPSILDWERTVLEL